MTQFLESWSKTTKAIYNGVLLYSIAGIFYSIIAPISKLGDWLSFFVSDFASLSIFSNILLVAIIIGYFLFLIGLGGLSKVLTSGDSAAVLRVRNAVLIVLIAQVFGFIPLLGWVGTILSIISFFLMILGYSALKSSTTFPSRARSGASKLFTAMILSLIGSILGFIPLVGGLFEMPLDIIAFILTLSGWAAIKNTVPEESEQNPNTY